MINTYCFDTNCLSYYYEKNENNLMRKKVRSLLAKLASEKAHIILPAPVLAEILVGFQTLEGIQIAENDISQTFEIKSFDRKCCHLAAYMFIEEKKNGYIEEGLKQKIKVDIQILSIVQSSNSLVFYTEDDKLLKLAERHSIKASRLPEVDPSQIPLFIEI